MSSVQDQTWPSLDGHLILSVPVQDDSRWKARNEYQPIYLPACNSTDASSTSTEQAVVKVLTPEQVLADLNDFFSTSLAITYPPLHSLLVSFISQGLDFWSIYARLRSNWPQTSCSSGSGVEVFGAERALVNEVSRYANRRLNAHVPRRIWDLRANRVIPSNYMYSHSHPGFKFKSFQAIVHRWIDDVVVSETYTRINGYQWPVPIPIGVDLELVRSELVALGAEYIWLDVLCVRLNGSHLSQKDLNKCLKKMRMDDPACCFHCTGGLGRGFDESSSIQFKTR